MSRFSGKCDLKDLIDIAGGFEEFKGTKLFAGSKEHELKYQSEKDLIPYYPYIETVGYFSKTSPEQCFIILSEKSWVDIVTERYGNSSYLDNYRKELKQELERMLTNE